MIEPKEFSINKKVSMNNLLKSGFVKNGNAYVYKKCLYYFDNTKAPYIMLKLVVIFDDDIPYLMYNVTRDDGSCYPAFYDPSVRHDNEVYEKVVDTYNEVVDKLVMNKILKERKGGRKQRGN